MPTAKQKNLRIIIFTHEFYPKKGGIATFIESMAYEAEKQGHVVEVFAPVYKNNAWGGKQFSYKVYTLQNRGTQSWQCRLATAWHMLKTRRKIESSILYLPEPGPIRLFMYLQLVGIIKPKKIIMTLHGSEIYNVSRWFYRRYLFRKLLNATEKVTVLSIYTAELLKQFFPEAAEKIVFTEGALPIGFKPERKHGKDPQLITLLTVARIHPRKGHMAVMEAINQLGSPYKNKILYQIVGPTSCKSYFRQLKDYAMHANIKVEFLGEVPDKELPTVYARADIFVMTSERYKKSVEGFGLVYLEASASGLPIVAYQSGGVAQAVEDKKTGILIEPGDINGLASAIQNLIDDPVARRAMGQAGSDKALATNWVDNARIAFQ